MDGLSPNQFRGFQKNSIPVVEDLLILSILIHDIDFVDGSIIGQFARIIAQKYENSVRLLRNNNLRSYVRNSFAVFQSRRRSSNHILLNKTINLERSICVQERSFKDIDVSKSIGKHIPISSFNRSNPVKQPILLRNSDLHHLITSPIRVLENIGIQSQALMKILFFDFKTTILNKMGSVSEKITQVHSQKKQTSLKDCNSKIKLLIRVVTDPKMLVN